MFVSKSNFRKSRKSSNTQNLGVMIIVAFVFIVGGIFLFSVVICDPLSNVYKSASWESVPAAVTASKLAESTRYNRSGKPSYTIKIEYRYEYNGKNCTGDRYDFFRSRNRYYSFGELDMLNIVNNHPAGKKITCLVNQENPDESVISRELYYPALAFGIIPIVLFCIGISIAIYLIINFKRSKKK